jgi:hypothetical protein
MDIWAVLQPSFNARSHPNTEIYTYAYGESNGTILEFRPMDLIDRQPLEDDGSSRGISRINRSPAVVN